MSWEDAFRDYLVGLDAKKPVIVCGDMNVAHNEIDLKNPKTNIGNPGFSFEERGKFTELLDLPTASAISIRTRPTRIHGGATAPPRASAMSAGVSTISSCPTG